MLSFDLRSLATRAVTVDAHLPPDDPIWDDADIRPAGPVHVTGRLSAAGEGRYYWHGRITGEAVASCRRCLTETKVQVDDEAHYIFAHPDPETADDPDVYTIEERAVELDLRPALREEWLLAAPKYALCREDCKGLCPTCGADLNQGPCECPPVHDARWDALRKPDDTAH